jgi:hypothetical protein
VTQATFTASDLSFDPATHEYRLPNGAIVPSVTQILSAVGVSVDFEALRASSERTAAAIDLKRDIGTALHADAYAFDDNDLDWSTVDPRVEPYLQAWATFRENTGLVPTTRERRVYNPFHGYAGTLDGIFRRPNGGLVLVDIKTGDPDDSGCAFQTAAYVAAYEFEHRDGEALAERWGVQLVPESRIPYRICPYTSWQDWPKFQAFVTTYYHQAARRRRAA